MAVSCKFERFGLLSNTTNKRETTGTDFFSGDRLLVIYKQVESLLCVLRDRHWLGPTSLLV